MSIKLQLIILGDNYSLMGKTDATLLSSLHGKAVDAGPGCPLERLLVMSTDSLDLAY